MDIQTLCLPNQSTAGKNVFPAPHTTTTAAGKLSPTCTNSGLKSIKKYRLGKKNSPSPAGAFNCAAPFFHAIPSAPVCPDHSQKTPVSGEAMCGQDFQPLTVVLVLSCFLKRLDWLTPLLFCSSLFLSQPSRKFGVGSISLPPPCSPPPNRKDCMPQSNTESLPFQGFCGMI